MAASDDIHNAEFIDLCQETAEDKTQPHRNAYQQCHLSEVLVTGVSSSVKPHQVSVSIRHDKMLLLESYVKKVEKNYCVKISKDVCIARSNGKSAPSMQMISISGSKGDCKNAGVRWFSFYC